ncbi:MAG: hypothetical protein HN623_03955, partial [Bdellovibrionales bacterium]|nr:hypothetical protein [Bdellovibrionales bacterium]
MNKTVITVLVIVMSIWAMSIYNISQHQFRVIHEKLELKVKKLSIAFKELVEDEDTILDGHFDTLPLNSKILELWRSGDRKGLFKAIAPHYKKLNKSFDVTHFYFINLDRTCFLRVHRPDQFGDQIKRYTLTSAIQTGHRTGIELGKLGHFTLRS